MLLVSQAVCRTHNITQGKATIACDNKRAISMLNEWCVPDPKDANFDLTSAIWKLLQDSPIQWHNIHVKGHQDDHLQCDKLNRVAQLNVEMDRLAKSFWRHCHIHQHAALQPLEPPQHPMHLEGWTLWNANTKVTHPNRQHLCKLTHDPITTSKWIRLERFPDSATSQIDSEMASKHTKALKPGCQRWITKHASHNCGVGTTLAEWQQQEDDQCPRCGQPEDTNHATRCTGAGATETWTEQMSVPTEWMTEANTHPLLQDTLITNLQRWRQGLPPVTALTMVRFNP